MTRFSVLDLIILRIVILQCCMCRVDSSYVRSESEVLYAFCMCAGQVSIGHGLDEIRG